MTANKALADYLRSLPPAERIAKSRDIREKLCISNNVLTSWRVGRTKIHPVFRDKIIEILGCDIFMDVTNN